MLDILDIDAPPREIPLLPDCDFKFAVGMALEKSEGGDERRFFHGLASCESRDLQGEEVLQRGMDFSPFLDNGYINWDHKDGPENLIGEPIEALVCPIESHPALRRSVRDGVTGLGFYVKGWLYEDEPRAQSVWRHMNRPGSGRRLAMSVQGRTLERDRHRITKSEIRHVAVTHQPIQTASWAEIAKSMASVMTAESAAPLRKEHLDGKLTSVLWGGNLSGQRCGCYQKSGRFLKGRVGALEHLVSCKGASVEDAHGFLKSLIESGIAR